MLGGGLVDDLLSLPLVTYSAAVAACSYQLAFIGLRPSSAHVCIPWPSSFCDLDAIFVDQITRWSKKASPSPCDELRDQGDEVISEADISTGDLTLYITDSRDVGSVLPE